MNRYNIRNVAEREIYDSYMGILRISPNPISESNNRLVDDPSSVLNSILTFDELSDKSEEVKIVLSDSDGNVLPVTFGTKARKTVVINGETNEYENLPIVNVITKLSKKLFISEKYKAYSTLYVDNTADNKIDKKLSSVQIVSNDGVNDNLLLYPVECPNDEDYFNKKNTVIPLDYDDIVSPHIQMKNKLYGLSQEEYKEKFGIKNDEFVSVNGKYVTTFNKEGEIIPVLQSRDYVLGHYEGHTLNFDNQIKDNWIGYDSDASKLTYQNGKITRLSWIRIDNLVWDIIDKVVRGDFRHSNGRYKALGYNQNNHINGTLFGEDGSNCSISNEDKADLNIEKTAPVLGRGVQKGLIMYHAMPFHRYMFHVARQICRNLFYQFGANENTYQVNEDDWKSFNTLANCLKIALNEDLISKVSDGTKTTLSSLCKDFLLCDGKSVTYRNYPNINIRNDDIFGKDIVMAIPDPNSHAITEDITTDGVVGAIKTSMGLGDLKTPSLYSLSETSPRFIRGLNWNVINHDDIIKLKSNAAGDTNVYYNSITNDTDGTAFPTILINEIEDKDYTEARTDGGNIKKDITAVGLYMHNYDIGIVRNDHYHKSFSDGDGTDLDKVSKNNTIGYECGRKRGAVNFLADMTYCPNQDFRFLNEKDNSSEWYNYCLGKTAKNLIYGCPMIPNAGLNLFNGDLVNSEDETIDDYDNPWKYRGTSGDIESHVKNKTYGYCDALGVWHDLEEIPDPKETLKGYLEKVCNKIGESFTEWLEDINKKTNPEKGEGEPVSFIQAVFDKIKEECLDTHKLSNSEIADIFRESFKDYYKKREIRRKQLIKMNESEGRIPAARSGGPYFKSSVVWSVVEKVKILKGKKQRRKAFSFYWAGVGNYIIGYNTKNYEGTERDERVYRCLTSIPYEDSSKLGVGDVTNEDSNDYYDTNSVTSLKQGEEYYKISYGGKELPVTMNVKGNDDEENDEEVSYVQSNIPTPANITLLPLIRI